MWHTTFNYNLLENILDYQNEILLINIFNRFLCGISYMHGCLIEI